MNYEFLKGKVVLLNAPPGAGKDVAATALQIFSSFHLYIPCDHLRFKEVLYEETAKYFGVNLEWLKDFATDRATKEVPTELLKVAADDYKLLQDICECRSVPDMQYIYISPRQALIFTSEVIIKPSKGSKYFGEKAAEKINLETFSVFSDSGFDEELLPIVAKVGKENVVVVKFTGQGSYDFLNDSRDWLNVPEGVKTLRMTNDSSVAEFVKDLLSKLGNIYV